MVVLLGKTLQSGCWNIRVSEWHLERNHIDTLMISLTPSQGFPFTFPNGGGIFPPLWGGKPTDGGGNSARMFRDKSKQLKAIKILDFYSNTHN